MNIVMAGEPKIKEATHSKTLFIDEKDTPRIFFMRPCSERAFLQPLIQHGGGQVTSKAGSGCIKLAEKGSTVTESNFISTKFIEDCVQRNKYLDPADYRIKPGTKVRKDSENSFSSDDSMSPASTIIKTTIKRGRGRTKYTKEEDIKIITFLMTERRYNETSGMRVWKDMELLGVTDHSAESMNTRYRKNILPKIEDYKHDISQKWISVLSGNIQKEKEPEFSAEALFKPRPKQISPANKQTDNKSTAEKCQLAGRNSFRKLMTGNTDISQSDNHKETQKNMQQKPTDQNLSTDSRYIRDQSKINVGSKCEKDGRKSLAKSDEKQACETDSESEEMKTDKQTRKLRKRPQHVPLDKTSLSKKAALEKGSSENVKETNISPKKQTDMEEDANVDTDSEENSLADEARTLRKRAQLTTTDQNNQRKKNTGIKESKTSPKQNRGTENSEKADTQCEDITSKIKSRKLRKRMQQTATVQRNTSKVTNVESSATENCMGPSKMFCSEEPSPKRSNRNETVESPVRASNIENSKGQTNENKQLVSHKSSNVQECETNKLNIATRRLNLDGSPSISPSKDTGKDEKMKNDLFKKTPEIHLERIDKELEILNSSQLINTAKHCKGMNRSTVTALSSDKGQKNDSDEVDRTEGSTVDSEHIENEDSFDEMIAGLAKGDSQKLTNMNTVTGNKIDSQIEMHNSLSTESVTVSANGEKKVPKARQKDNQHTSKGVADSTTDNVFSFNSDDEEDEDIQVAECRKVCRGIARKFDLSSEYVRKLLYRNNGHVNRTVCWIKFGPHTPWPPSWTENDDSCLVEEEELQRLLAKFGASDVEERLHFLGLAPNVSL